jgi:branched-chain amino acid aminotransferase
MQKLAFLNDRFVTEENAVLHFRDLAIQRGYGVFDFFKVLSSVPVFLDEHLERFYFSAEQMRLPVSFSKQELKNIITELLQKNSIADTGIRITLTGGYSADGYQIAKPNLLITLHSFTPPTKEQFEKGIKLLTYEHQRQLPQVKTIDYLMAIWLQKLIKENSADDVLYHQDGVVTECPRSNFFLVTQDNTIVTPATKILKGVVRTKLLNIASTEFRTEERDVTIEEIKSAKEAFITSTTKTILSVRQIDKHIFSENKSVAHRLLELMLQLY